jgi:predicted O-linked N-acetylglucosamine transferase (SPINDLY family)
VIVETSGFTANSGIEILAERCAPVQCHYIGFHASTGLDTMDWFIGDELTAAEDLADQYVERLWPLPRPWLASRRLTDEMPDPQARVDGPIPVLGSFSQFGKVGPHTIHFWARALHQLPEAVLHLKNYSTDSDVPQRRILENMVNEGIDPERVTFLPRTSSWREHMECYEAIDVALDTTPWSGATTAFEALSMGVPVVGILGSTTSSRMSCSILQALGKGAWIASTPEVFAQAVEQIVSDLPKLRGSRLALRQQVLNSSLFDGADLARHLQEAFEAMVRDRTHGGRQGQEQPEGARRRRLDSQ